MDYKVEHCVEILCQQGCRTVWGTITSIENGDSLAETVGLDQGQVQDVLNELKSIMAVYEGSCVPG